MLPFFDGFYWLLGGGLYIFGATVYMLRIPERWFPNKFDFFVILQLIDMIIGSISLNIPSVYLSSFSDALLCLIVSISQ